MIQSWACSCPAASSSQACATSAHPGQVPVLDRIVQQWTFNTTVEVPHPQLRPPEAPGGKLFFHPEFKLHTIHTKNRQGHQNQEERIYCNCNVSCLFVRECYIYILYIYIYPPWRFLNLQFIACSSSVPCGFAVHTTWVHSSGIPKIVLRFEFTVTLLLRLGVVVVAWVTRMEKERNHCLIPIETKHLPTKETPDLPPQKKILHTHSNQKASPFSPGGAFAASTCWASPAVRRSRYYQRSPTHGDPSSLPARNLENEICSQLGQSWKTPIFLFMLRMYGNLGGR